jgi:hypothetical protein
VLPFLINNTFLGKLRIVDKCKNKTFRDKFQLDPCGNISSDMPGFKKNPGLDDKIHCVAIVQDATIVDAMQDLSPEVTKNIKDMQTVMNSLGRCCV